MNTIVKDLVEYLVICDEAPLSVENYTSFILDDFIELDIEKPLIKQISKVSVKCSVAKDRLIKSNIGKSLAGCESKGFKYLCQILISWRVEYIDTEKNSIFSTTGESTLNTFVSLSSSCKYSTPISSVYIDDVHVELLCANSFFINFSGIVLVENN